MNTSTARTIRVWTKPNAVSPADPILFLDCFETVVNLDTEHAEITEQKLYFGCEESELRERAQQWLSVEGLPRENYQRYIDGHFAQPIDVRNLA